MYRFGEVICPYCEHQFYPDDFYDGHNSSCEWQCPECEKNFYMSWEWEPVFHSNQAPCLNDGEHDFRIIHGIPQEYFINRVRCSYCGEEKTDQTLWEKLKNEY